MMNLGDIYWAVTDAHIPPGIPSTGGSSDNVLPDEVRSQFSKPPYTIHTFLTEAERKAFIQNLAVVPQVKITTTSPPMPTWHLPDFSLPVWGLLALLGIAGVFGARAIVNRRRRAA